jgi:hypothetical protein
MAEQMARHLVGFFADVRDNQLGETSTDLGVLLGRAPASLKDGLAELSSANVSGSGMWPDDESHCNELRHSSNSVTCHSTVLNSSITVSVTTSR